MRVHPLWDTWIGWEYDGTLEQWIEVRSSDRWQVSAAGDLIYTDLDGWTFFPYSAREGTWYPPPVSTPLTSSSGAGSGGFGSSGILGCQLDGVPLLGDVYLTDYSYQADFDIYLVDYSYQADLDVYLTDYSYQASRCGEWYLVDYSYQADFEIYLVDYSYQADFDIYLVDYSYQAGQ